MCIANSESILIWQLESYSQHISNDCRYLVLYHINYLTGRCNSNKIWWQKNISVYWNCSRNGVLRILSHGYIIHGCDISYVILSSFLCGNGQHCKLHQMKNRWSKDSCEQCIILKINEWTLSMMPGHQPVLLIPALWYQMMRVATEISPVVLNSSLTCSTAIMMTKRGLIY